MVGMVPKKMRCKFFDKSGKESPTIPTQAINQRKKGLTPKPALVIQLDTVCVNGRFNMLDCLVPLSCPVAARRAESEAETDAELTIFDSSALKKQLYIFPPQGIRYQRPVADYSCRRRQMLGHSQETGRSGRIAWG
jgi:hypothetical protein